MKITILLLFFSLWTFVGLGQQYKTQQQSVPPPMQTHVDYNGKVYEWTKINRECANCASFYIKVVRSSYKDNYNLYNYSILFYSNSYINGYLSSTYLINVYFYATAPRYRERFLWKADYILVPPKNPNFDGTYIVLNFQSTFPNEVIRIGWQNFTTY